MTRLADIVERALRAVHMPTGALRCTCPACADLDRAHPHEGYQLRLFPGALAGEPDVPARPTDPDAPATPLAGVSKPQGRPSRDPRSRPAPTGAPQP